MLLSSQCDREWGLSV